MAVTTGADGCFAYFCAREIVILRDVNTLEFLLKSGISPLDIPPCQVVILHHQIQIINL